MIGSKAKLFISAMYHVDRFLWVSPTNKTDCHDIAEILLRVALNPINQTTLTEITWHKKNTT
jgi:hypothetical protein